MGIELGLRTPAQKPRERWIDVAKGIAIILVVFLHSTFDYRTSVHEWQWVDYSALLETFRMPLFFFTAGLFASKVLSKSFRELVNLRVLRFGWLYVLWSTLAVFILTPILVGWPGVAGTAGYLASMFVIPNPATWFIFAITVYFLAAWPIRRLPLPVQVIIGVALTLFFQSGLLTPADSEWAKVGKYFLFFLLAVEFGPRLRRWVPSLRWWHTLVAPIVYVAGVVLFRWIGWLNAPVGSPSQMAAWLVLSVLAVAAGCSVALLVARWAAFDWLFWLGSRTLQVYLLHWYFLTIGWLAIAAVPVMPSAVVPFLAPLLTAFAIGGSLIVHRLTERARFLYGKPAWLRLPARRVAAQQL